MKTREDLALEAFLDAAWEYAGTMKWQIHEVVGEKVRQHCSDSLNRDWEAEGAPGRSKHGSKP